MPLEKDLEKKLIKKVEAKGCLTYKFESPGHRGVPDRIVISPSGIVYFVELKKPKTGRLSALQKWNIAQIKAHDGHIYTINNDKELEAFLGTIV